MLCSKAIKALMCKAGLELTTGQLQEAGSVLWPGRGVLDSDPSQVLPSTATSCQPETAARPQDRHLSRSSSWHTHTNFTGNDTLAAYGIDKPLFVTGYYYVYSKSGPARTAKTMFTCIQLFTPPSHFLLHRGCLNPSKKSLY